MKSPANDLVSVAEALNHIKRHMPHWPEYGETTAEPFLADRDQPAIHRVMMDGIAISHAAYARGQRTFHISGVCAAGSPEQTLPNPDFCMEVMTGAPLPSGADLVVPYEHLKIIEGTASIAHEVDRSPMDHVHRRGSDFKAGHIVLDSGQILNGPHRGIAASLGYAHPKTNRQPKINIISTGDELVALSEKPLPHQTRRSNVFSLEASLNFYGYTDITLSHLPDDKELITRHYQENAKNFNLFIYSGGVSMGKFDYLPKLWAHWGITKHFHGVSQKPGKPLWFGSDEKHKTVILGLPGNPVSSLVCLHRYLLSRKEIYVQLEEEMTIKNNLTFFLPAKIKFNKTGIISACTLRIKNSGEYSALAGSDGFIELPPRKTHYPTNEPVLFHPWRPL